MKMASSGCSSRGSLQQGPLPQRPLLERPQVPAGNFQSHLVASATQTGKATSTLGSRGKLDLQPYSYIPVLSWTSPKVGSFWNALTTNCYVGSYAPCTQISKVWQDVSLTIGLSKLLSELVRRAERTMVFLMPPFSKSVSLVCAGKSQRYLAFSMPFSGV